MSSKSQTAEAIEVVERGGEFYLATDCFPLRAIIPEALTRRGGARPLVAVEGNTVTVRLANATGVYDRVAETLGGEGWICELRV